MEKNRDQYIQEYFELVKYLNSANKTKDQKTEVYFFIKMDGKIPKLYAAISETQKIFLCYKNEMTLWVRGGASGYYALEQILCKILSMRDVQGLNLTETIKSHLFKLS